MWLRSQFRALTGARQRGGSSSSCSDAPARRAFARLVVAAAAGLVVAAGQTAGQPPGGQPGQQAPVRDQPAQQRLVIGTGSITGQVVAADTGRPLRRARVIATSPAAGGARSALTDTEGRYQLTALPAGQYQVAANKSGYMPAGFGQDRARRRSARPVTLTDGQRVEGIDFSLPKGGVICGHVFDEDGEPLLRAQVSVYRSIWGPGGRQLVNAGSGTSDDRGYYRVFGLMPGTYYVAAYTRNPELANVRPVVAEAAARVVASLPTEGEDGPLGFSPTYYPGVTTAAEASPVAVAIQQETSEINFTLRFVTTARVGGTVTAPDGTAVQGVVSLTSEDAGALRIGPTLSGAIRPDGSFVVNSVPPGRYVAVARTGGGRMGGGGQGAGTAYFASQPVAVHGQDVSVALTLARGTTISGTITFESMGDRAGEQSRVNVSLTPLPGLGDIPGGFGGGGSFRAQANGAFAITNVAAGTYLVRVGGFGSGWAVKGVYLGGRDVADAPIEVKSGQPITGLSVVLTDQPSMVTGTVASGDGEPVLDGFVLLYSTDPARWRPGTRLLQVARPDQNGAYRLRGMPPGDYYLVSVVDLDDNEWYDPSVLEALRQVATRITVQEGQTETRALRAMAIGG